MRKKTKTKRITGLAREAQDALEAGGLTRQQCIEYRDAVRFYEGLSDAQKEEFRTYFTDGEQTSLVAHVFDAASPDFREFLKGIVRAAAELTAKPCQSWSLQ
jgi:phage-related protein